MTASTGATPSATRSGPRFDCHFHDCDEYWILFAGRGIAVSEGKRYEVASGDCVATGMGHHHDFPIVQAAGAGRLLRDYDGRGEAAGAPVGPHPREGGAEGGAGVRGELSPRGANVRRLYSVGHIPSKGAPPRTA